jgi:predicted nucleic acid-binding protein
MNEGDSFFVDTNVLLYHLSGALPEKQARAELWMDSLWAGDSGRLSWQVLHEFYVNAVKKLRVPELAARTYATRLTEWNPTLPGLIGIQRAWHWCDAAQINFWDALILAAAEQAGCRYLLSEDFQASRRYGGITVVNPFARSPSEFFG